MSANFMGRLFSPCYDGSKEQKPRAVGVSLGSSSLSVGHQFFFIIKNEFYNLLIFSLGGSAYSPPQWYTVEKGQLHVRTVSWSCLPGTELRHGQGGSVNPEVHLLWTPRVLGPFPYFPPPPNNPSPRSSRDMGEHLGRVFTASHFHLS